MSGKILCISSGAVASLYYGRNKGWFCSDHRELERFKRLVRHYHLFVERDRAEKDLGLVQLIPSCVIATGTKILCLQRSRNAARSELKSKWTSLFGGHVDETDKDAGDGWQTVLNGVRREVREELGIEIAESSPQLAGLAIDPSNRTGRIHLGVIFYFTAASEQVRLHGELDLEEFEIEGSKTVSFFSPKRVHSVQNQFDPWSTLFFNSDFARWQLQPEFCGEEDLPLLQAARG